MDRFKKFIAGLDSFKRIALTTFLCLVLQAVLFCLGLIVCLSVIQPNSPTMFEENTTNSFSKFAFLIVPLILFFSAFCSSLSIFSMIAPKGFRQKMIFPAFIVGLIQIVSVIFSTVLLFVVLIYGLHFIFAVVPICFLIILSAVVGNNFALKALK